MQNVAQELPARPSGPNEIDRPQWLVVYRGMRRARSHAVNWINRSAGTPRGCVAAPRRLARNILTVFHEEDPATIAMLREHGEAAMQFARHAANLVFALKLLPEAVAESHFLAWGLACLAELVADRSQGVGASTSFQRNTAPLFRAFGWRGRHMLQSLVADTLLAAWSDVSPDFAHVVLRERLQRFKKSKAAKAERTRTAKPVPTSLQLDARTPTTRRAVAAACHA